MADPFLRLFPDAWLGDTPLQSCRPSTRGAWANLLMYMQDAPNRGELVLPAWRLQQMAGVTPAEWSQFLVDQNRYKFCDMEGGEDSVIIRNRRMIREEIRREDGRKRTAKSRAKAKGDTNVTPGEREGNSDTIAIAIAITKETISKTTEEDAPGAVADSRGFEIHTRKKKTLTGFKADAFMVFWHVFKRKRGRAEAADAWLEMLWPAKLADKWLLVRTVIVGAMAEAKERWDEESHGITPMYPQGWITARRWENHEAATDKEKKAVTMDQFKVRFQATLDEIRTTLK